MCKTTNGEYCGARATEIHGMIDGNTFISSANTLTKKCGRIKKGIFDAISIKVIANIIRKAVDIVLPTTNSIGNTLVKLNTKMYNKKMQISKNINKKDIPSLIIASTMDMGWTNWDVYKKSFGDESNYNIGGDWDKLVKETVATVVANPLRLFPLFSYEPRRYKDDGDDSKPNRSLWSEPFAHIVGNGGEANKGKDVWLGFCMNPQFGFRPFDESLGFLTMFYERCARENIPILAHCAPDGIASYRAREYDWFDRDDGIARTDSDIFRGNDIIVDDRRLDHFCVNYGHPRNWIPVLRRYNALRLCLAGFGGNSEWGHEEMSRWNGRDLATLQREWIRCIIKLTKYGNVYADFSGIDISDNNIKNRFMDMLRLIISSDGDFAHLKYKLIFGSGWYLTEYDYEKYCDEFKTLFYNAVGKEKGWKLWERVSLINPWKFYGFDKNIDALHSVLDANKKVNRTMLEKMHKVFFGTNKIVDSIKQCSVCDPEPPLLPNEESGDLGRSLMPARSNPTILCSIFKMFNIEHDNEKSYCFFKFHTDGSKACYRIVDECPLSPNFYCANRVDGFSEVIDELVEEMWELMDPEDRELDGSMRQMRRNIKKRLRFIILDRGGQTDAHKVTGGHDSIVSDIRINVNKQSITTLGPKWKARHVIEHPNMRANLVGDLLYALVYLRPVANDESDIEVMLKAVLIHELRHVWQYMQPINNNIRRSKEIYGWFEPVWLYDHINDGIDIMAEVDAYEIQRRYENDRFQQNRRLIKSDSTKKFNILENDTQGKVEYLWNWQENPSIQKKTSIQEESYIPLGYGTKTKKDSQGNEKYLFRNTYGLRYHNNTNRQTPVM